MKMDSIGTFARFLTWGFLLNLIGVLLFYALIKSGAPGENALLIASFVLMPFSFMANKNIIFHNSLGGTRARYRFVFAYLVVVACNYLYLRILLQIFRVDALIAQLIFLGVVVIGSFLLQKLWVFRSDLSP
jgi:putative flippase GtrA